MNNDDNIEITVEALYKFRVDIEHEEDISHTKWRSFFIGTGDYISHNEIEDLEEYKTLKAIISTLNVIDKHCHSLPTKLQEPRIINSINHLLFRSKTILLEFKHQSYKNAPDFYTALGKGLEKIGRVL